MGSDTSHQILLVERLPNRRHIPDRLRYMDKPAPNKPRVQPAHQAPHNHNWSHDNRSNRHSIDRDKRLKMLPKDQGTDRHNNSWQHYKPLRLRHKHQKRNRNRSSPDHESARYSCDHQNYASQRMSVATRQNGQPEGRYEALVTRLRRAPYKGGH